MDAIDDNDPLLKPSEAAGFLRVSARTLEAWRYRDEGPTHVKFSQRCVRYRQSDLEAFVRKSSVGRVAAYE